MSQNFNQSGASRGIMIAGVILGGLVAAFLAGSMVAKGDYQNLAAIGAGALAIMIGLLLGNRYWLLIPLTYGATGSASVLPLPFSYAEMGIIGAFGLYAIHVCFKKVTVLFKAKAVDFILYLNLAYLISVFLRNPVGVQAFGTDLIGGRPYFTVLLGFLAYQVLSNSRMPALWAPAFPLILTCSIVIPGLLVVTTDFVPSLSKIIYPFYNAVSIQAFSNAPTQADLSTGDDRITSLISITSPIIVGLCTYFPAATLINPLYLGRFLMFLGTLIMTGLSGFRNKIVEACAMLTISTLIRGRFTDLCVIGLVGTLAVGLLALSHQSGIAVPTSIQRSLAFLPLGWDSKAVAAADQTVEWREGMWKEAWNNPQYMRNKLLGDGFGYTQKEFMIMQSEMLGGTGFMGVEESYEGHLIRGSFHNGPLSAIKFVGFVGFIFLLLLFYLLFRYALAVLRMTKGTPYRWLAIYLALPIFYLPFEYTFIFGAYSNALLLCMFSLGMLNLTHTSVKEWKAEQEFLQHIPTPSPNIAPSKPAIHVA